MKLIIHWLVTAIAVSVAISLVPGIAIVGTVETWIATAAFSLALTLINISIKPLMQFLSFPISILTLGLFYLVVNTLMLYLAAGIANGLFQVGFEMSSFGSAFVASIVISIVSAIMNFFVGNNE